MHRNKAQRDTESITQIFARYSTSHHMHSLALLSSAVSSSLSFPFLSIAYSAHRLTILVLVQVLHVNISPLHNPSCLLSRLTVSHYSLYSVFLLIWPSLFLSAFYWLLFWFDSFTYFMIAILISSSPTPSLPVFLPFFCKCHSIFLTNAFHPLLSSALLSTPLLSSPEVNFNVINALLTFLFLSPDGVVIQRKKKSVAAAGGAFFWANVWMLGWRIWRKPYGTLRWFSSPVNPHTPVLLCCAVLCCAVLCCAVLCCTVLYCAMLCCSMLCCAVLCCAVLHCSLMYCVALCCLLSTVLCTTSLFDE